MKKIVAVLVFLLLFFAFPRQVEASELSIQVNDEDLVFDQMPILRDGRVYIPIRKVTEATGGKVTYDERTKNISIQKDETTILFSTKETTALVNGAKKELPKPIVVNNRTLVPVRFVSENVGLKVDWLGKEKKVVIKDRKVEAENKARQLFAEKLLETGEVHIGVPYLLGGTTPEKGFDCSALIQSMYREMGITLSRTTYQQVFEGVSVKKKDLKTGDLVFFDTDGNGKASHVAIYVDEHTLFHATNSKGVDYTPFSDYWQEKIVEYRRVF